MEVNSRSNWLVSIDPTTVGVQGGMIRPAISPSKSVSLKEGEESREGKVQLKWRRGKLEKGGREERGGWYEVGDRYEV
jgi:hypothetical protein